MIMEQRVAVEQGQPSTVTTSTCLGLALLRAQEWSQVGQERHLRGDLENCRGHDHSPVSESWSMTNDQPTNTWIQLPGTGR